MFVCFSSGDLFIFTVSFSNFLLPIIVVLQNLSEFSFICYTGVLKKLIGLVTDHVINRRQFGKPLAEYEIIQEKVAKVTALTYAMESMTYLTAGMLDSYENPDCSMEAAIVKVNFLHKS